MTRASLLASLLPACDLEVILGFDGSRDQNVFVAQKGLESKVDIILNRISQMQRISCSGNQTPTVRVSVVANTPTGPVEAFDFDEYRAELFEKFRGMRSQHPYVLTADTLRLYQNKFRQSSPDTVKVSGHGAQAPGRELPGCPGRGVSHEHALCVRGVDPCPLLAFPVYLVNFIEVVYPAGQ